MRPGVGLCRFCYYPPPPQAQDAQGRRLYLPDWSSTDDPIKALATKAYVPNPTISVFINQSGCFRTADLVVNSKNATVNCMLHN